ncbi:hypothetical protein [Streptomyces sp. rh34]|uniref:hypothetical protein n=1 Tax=Streptomyces sp. rh34 TaxID=2034272 RepID=UPI0015CF2211|nr:hypothetical protein [Streptomyces sp. rh34]
MRIFAAHDTTPLACHLVGEGEPLIGDPVVRTGLTRPGAAKPTGDGCCRAVADGRS